MKNSFLLILLMPFFLISCGKTEEIKIVEGPPPVIQNLVVATGGTIESGSGKIDVVSNGAISSGAISISGTKPRDNMYTNKDFGFQINFPSSWGEYKTRMDVINNTPAIDFLVSTNDQRWGEFPDALVFKIKVIKNDTWTKHIEDCKNKMAKGLNDLGSIGFCKSDVTGDYVIGKTDLYTLVVITGQDAPSDMNQYYMSMGGSSNGPGDLKWIGYLRQNFTAIK